MSERKNTGGLKQFHITNSDRKNWENKDTFSTRDFKEALSEWRDNKEKKKSITIKINNNGKLSLFSKIKLFFKKR